MIRMTMTVVMSRVDCYGTEDYGHDDGNDVMILMTVETSDFNDDAGGVDEGGHIRMMGMMRVMMRVMLMRVMILMICVMISLMRAMIDDVRIMMMKGVTMMMIWLID